MPVARREAEVVWEGSLACGVGTLTSGSGALEELAVTWASRTERHAGGAHARPAGLGLRPAAATRPPLRDAGISDSRR